MRRFVTLAVLLLFTIPFGVSISGCKAAATPVFCNGGDSGPTTDQITTLTLQPRLTGISINEGQLGQVSTPTATNCKGNNASATSFTYGTTNMFIADINPSNGQLCAGSWNRNTGAGIPDYTTCTFIPGVDSIGTAYVTASSNGVTSNPIAVYIHPIVTSVVLGAPSTNCTTDPASNCGLDPTQATGCSTGAITVSTAATYTGNACVSSGALAQLAARVYMGTTGQTLANNISCLVGPLTFTPQNSAIATVNQAGVATALQPGATIVNANIAQSSSSAGLFSTCPPASIQLTVTNTGATSTIIDQNATQNLTATVVDTKGVALTNLTLEYNSTTPTTIAANGLSVTPSFPGSAAITATCQPPLCNPSPTNDIGLFGTGLPVISNPVTVTSPGTNSTVLYMASTQSQYIVPIDFTGALAGAPVRLPFVPNSMVINQNLSAIYMGTATELMTFNPASNSLASQDNSVAGIVLSVSPDSSTVVITDPVRQLVYLYSASGGVASEIGGVGTHAQWSPDSSTVYITTSSNELLVHSTLFGWTTITPATKSPATLPSFPLLDIAVTVPARGAYFAGTTTTARTNCPVTTVTGTTPQGIASILYYPQSDSAAVATDRIAATNSGTHIIGAAVATDNLVDLTVTVPASGNSTAACPTDAAGDTVLQNFSNSPLSTSLSKSATVTPTAITGVLTTSDSAYAFITYTGTGSVVPQYAVGTSTLTDLPLVTAAGSATPIAPAAGVLSSDDQTLYVGTTGDNLVHIFTRGTSGFTDTSRIAPALPGITGGTATPNLLVQRPRKSTT